MSQPGSASRKRHPSRSFWSHLLKRPSRTFQTGLRLSKNIPDNEIQPYTPLEESRILTACDSFGRTPYERLRAKAMIQLHRFHGPGDQRCRDTRKIARRMGQAPPPLEGAGPAAEERQTDFLAHPGGSKVGIGRPSLPTCGYG